MNNNEYLYFMFKAFSFGHNCFLAIVLLFLFFGVNISVIAQDLSLVPAEEKTLLQRVTDGRRDIDWANMNIQFCTAADAAFTNGSLENMAFKVHRVRLEVLGAFREKFSYHFRQSFNKYTNPNIPLDNLAGSVELAMVGWQLNDRWHLTAGKQPVQFSGYECWVNAIKVRHYSDFNNTIPAYQVGLNMAYSINQNQMLNFQVTNNRNSTIEDQFMYGLPKGIEDSKIPVLGTVNWDGFFVDRAMQLRYSLSYGQLAKGKNIFYFTCGNVWDKKPFLGYIDFMYSREGLDSKGLVTSVYDTKDNAVVTARNVEYFTTIANLDYRVSPHLNLYVKGAYELGNVYKSSEDFQAGNYRRTWNVQFCAEYYPMSDSELIVYLHLLHKNTHLTDKARKYGANSYNQQRVSLGLVYTLPVF